VPKQYPVHFIGRLPLGLELVNGSPTASDRLLLLNHTAWTDCFKNRADDLRPRRLKLGNNADFGFFVQVLAEKERNRNKEITSSGITQ
jgi:hypothetical protein